MRYRHLKLLSVPVILAVLLVSGCQRGKEPGSRTERIVLGALLPLTGDVARYSKAAERGIDLAVSEGNRGGGVRGRMLNGNNAFLTA